MSLFDLTVLFKYPNHEENKRLVSHTMDNINKNSKYPPYNIKIENNKIYIIEIAVAGFKEEELSVSLDNNHLYIKSLKEKKKLVKHYLHKGIAFRNFEKVFKLGNNIKISKCYLSKGILHIPLHIKTPYKDEKKNIKIEKY